MYVRMYLRTCTVYDASMYNIRMFDLSMYVHCFVTIHMKLCVRRFGAFCNRSLAARVHVRTQVQVCMIVPSVCVSSHEITPYVCTSMDVNGMAMQVSLLQCCCGPGLLRHPERQTAPPGRAGSA